MNSDEINQILSDLDNKEINDFQGTGKAIPYIGWFWRNVNFDKPFYIGHIKTAATKLEDSADWIGFMVNNKWGYDERLVTEGERKTIKEMCVNICKKQDQESCIILCNYLQTLKI